MNINKLFPLFVAGSVLSVSVSVFAHDGASSIYDTDGDGVVTTAEVTAVKTADFTAADVSPADGFLSLAEFENMENTIHARQIKATFDALDTTVTDSSLTQAEFLANATTATSVYLTNAFKLADVNPADGTLSLTEFTALKDRDSNHLWEFARIDTSGDQLLTSTEYTATSVRGGHAEEATGTGGNGGKGGKGRH